MSRRMISPTSLASMILLSSAIAVQAMAPAAAPKTYDWLAEFVSADASAKTITVKARIPDYVTKYINDFKPGARVLLLWNVLPPHTEPAPPPPPPPPPADADKQKPGSSNRNMGKGGMPIGPPIVLKTESDLILTLFADEPGKPGRIDSGYVLPAEFVSAAGNAITVKLRVADATLQAVASAQPGKWLRATSPLSQPTEAAAISAVTIVNGPLAVTAK